MNQQGNFLTDLVGKEGLKMSIGIDYFSIFVLAASIFIAVLLAIILTKLLFK